MMYPEIIIYNNEAQCDALMLRLNQRLEDKNLFKGLENSWTYKIYHTDGRVALVISRTAKHWNEIEAEITPNEINNITYADASWFPNLDI